MTDSYGNKITMSSSQASIKQAIQKYQEEHNLDVTGDFTEQTRAALDADIYEKWENAEVITLPALFKVYLGPGTDYDYNTLATSREATVIDKTSADGWWQVRLNPGGLGWIQVQGGDSQ